MVVDRLPGLIAVTDGTDCTDSTDVEEFADGWA